MNQKLRPRDLFFFGLKILILTASGLQIPTNISHKKKPGEYVLPGLHFVAVALVVKA
jgi:hypothetical protein